MTQQATIETYRQEYERYREEYRLSNPPPRLRLKSPLREWRFWIFGPVALFAPVVSGFRTFASFEHVAAILPVLEGLLGVIAVELGLIGYQIERIQRKARAGKLKGLGEGWLMAGVGLTLAIALLANVDLVLEAAKQPLPDPYRGWIIGGVVGGLVPLLGLIAGEVLGRLFYEIDQDNQATRKRHRRELGKWEQSLSASWQRVRGKRLRQYEAVPGEMPPAIKPQKELPGAVPQELPQVSAAMEAHLAAIGQAMGQNHFDRRQVEAIARVGTRQARNIIVYGIQHGVVVETDQPFNYRIRRNGSSS